MNKAPNYLPSFIILKGSFLQYFHAFPALKVKRTYNIEA